MGASFKDGLAICAIIHRYRPDLIDFYSLNAEDVVKNNQLAFDMLEKELNIPSVRYLSFFFCSNKVMKDIIYLIILKHNEISSNPSNKIIDIYYITTNKQILYFFMISFVLRRKTYFSNYDHSFVSLLLILFLFLSYDELLMPNKNIKST